MNYDIRAECHPPAGLPALPEILERRNLDPGHAMLAVSQLFAACSASGIFECKGATIVIKITEARGGKDVPRDGRL